MTIILATGAQTDVQNVPVDLQLVTPKLAETLIRSAAKCLVEEHNPALECTIFSQIIEIISVYRANSSGDAGAF